MAGWDSVVNIVASVEGVTAAAPFVHTQAGVSKNSNYAEGAYVMGILPMSPGMNPVTSILRTATGGGFPLPRRQRHDEGRGAWQPPSRNALNVIRFRIRETLYVPGGTPPGEIPAPREAPPPPLSGGFTKGTREFFQTPGMFQKTKKPRNPPFLFLLKGGPPKISPPQRGAPKGGAGAFFGG